MEKEIAKNIKPTIKSVLLTVCTCKRPKMLRECLLSINNLEIPNGLKAEILVVDNDSEETGRAVAEELVSKIKIPLHYKVEPKRGIANARNKLLEEAIKLDCTHILMFDDDELLTEKTLVAHMEMYNNNEKAVIISGPAPNVFDKKYPNYVKKHFVFKQRYTKKTGYIRNTCATSNVFFPTTLINEYGLRFSNEYVFMGGEDGEFFERATALGFTIVWCREAVVCETVPPARANLNYILRKCYYIGFASAYHKFKNKPTKFKKNLYVTKTGLVLLANGLTLLPSILLGRTCFFNVLGRCLRAIGKIDGATQKLPFDFYRNIYGE